MGIFISKVQFKFGKESRTFEYEKLVEIKLLKLKWMG